jgi:biopolymer transport protein ExbD
MKRYSGRHQPRLITEISVTPLLDLVFVLLFVFILAAPLMKTGPALALGTASSSAEPQPDDVAILTVDAQRFMTLDLNPVPNGGLASALRALREKRPGAAVLVEMHSDLSVHLLVAIMEQLRAAGIEKTSVTSRLMKAP